MAFALTRVELDLLACDGICIARIFQRLTILRASLFGHLSGRAATPINIQVIVLQIQHILRRNLVDHLPFRYSLAHAIHVQLGELPFYIGGNTLHRALVWNQSGVGRNILTQRGALDLRQPHAKLGLRCSVYLNLAVFIRRSVTCGHQIHATNGANAWMTFGDMRMHGAYIDLLIGWESGGWRHIDGVLAEPKP